MERRWNERKLVQVNALIDSTNTLISGKTENICMGGMYIKIAPDVKLHNNHKIKVSLANGKEMVSFLATIIRVDNDGLAVKFTDYSTETLSTLRDLLSEEGEAPRTVVH